MIAPIVSNQATFAALQSSFVREILPAVVRQVRFSYRGRAVDVLTEVEAECVALAWKYFVYLQGRGKNPSRFRSRFAEYVVRAYRNGRRTAGALSCRDVCSTHSQRMGGFRVESLNASAAQYGTDNWQEALTQDRRRGRVAEIVAFRLDFAAWLRRLPPRNRRIAKWLALGHGTFDTSRLFNVSPGRVSQLRRELHANWLAFQGQEEAT